MNTSCICLLLNPKCFVVQTILPTNLGTFPSEITRVCASLLKKKQKNKKKTRKNKEKKATVQLVTDHSPSFLSPSDPNEFFFTTVVSKQWLANVYRYWDSKRNQSNIGKNSNI